MENQIKNKKTTLFVVSTGRSFTSLTSNWLEKCGLFLGKIYKEKDVGNPNGFYEDQEFLDIHNEILKSNGFSHHFKINSDRKISIPQYLDVRLTQLIDKRNINLKQWGIKDPMASLLLPYYESKIENLKLIIIYRNYNDVVLSYYDYYKKSRNNSKKKYIYNVLDFLEKRKIHNKFLLSWIKYNEELISFIEKKNPLKDYIVLHYTDIIKNDKNIFNFLEKNMALELNYHNINNLFIKELHHDYDKYPSFDKNLEEKANNIIFKLNKLKTFQ